MVEILRFGLDGLDTDFAVSKNYEYTIFLYRTHYLTEIKFLSTRFLSSEFQTKRVQRIRVLKLSAASQAIKYDT